jgi:hypothetical protein
MAFKIILYQANHFPFFGVPPGLFFRIDQCAVDIHLEAPAVRRNQGDRFSFGFKMLQQFGRQTGSLVSIVSDRAILDRDF